MKKDKQQSFWSLLVESARKLGNLNEKEAQEFSDRVRRNNRSMEHWTEEAFRWVTFATITATLWALALSTNYWLLYVLSGILSIVIWLRISWAFNRTYRPQKNADGSYSVWKPMRRMLLTFLASVVISYGLYQIGLRIAELQIMATTVEPSAPALDSEETQQDDQRADRGGLHTEGEKAFRA